MSTQTEQIDAVITWVDGKDKAHYKKRQQVLAHRKGVSASALKTGTDETRFIDNGELEYCVQSIKKFAPWIRKIHIVTDNQIPDFATPEYQKKNNVRIVDHTEILESYEWALPTFNSRTIESALWRIKDLADRFIYFNDDFVLTQKVVPEDFFVDGKVVLRGRWNIILSNGSVRMKMNHFISKVAKKLFGITHSMHLLYQIKSAEMAGFKRVYYRAPHVPQPVQTQTLKDFFAENNDVFEQNIKYKFRNADQYSAIYLANHLELKHKNAELKKAGGYIMLNGERDFSWQLRSKLRQIKKGKVHFTCLHGIESLKEADRSYVFGALDRFLSS